MPAQITVTAVPGGWALKVGDMEGPQLFSSGAAAEAAARRLAERLARAGQASEVVIYLRDGSVAGQQVYADPAPRRGHARRP